MIFFFFSVDRVFLYVSPGCLGSVCRPGWSQTHRYSRICLPPKYDLTQYDLTV